MNFRVERAVGVLRRAVAGVLAELRAVARRSTVRPQTVFYESFAGNGALCNPEALFRYLLDAEDFADFQHTWALKSGSAALRREFSSDPRVSFVRYRSLRYFRALATHRFLVNNATFPPEFSKRAGQIYLNTWHGTPLKLMGYDMPNGAFDSANTLRNFVSADFLLSQNSFMTEQMYEKAYKLRGIFRGTIIEAGYPRTDRQFLDAEAVRAGRRILETSGIPVRNRTIVLYAPTWKGSSFSTPDDDARALAAATAALQQLLGDAYIVLLKTHQAVHQFAAGSDAGSTALAKVLVSNDLPTNLVLGLTQVLVTDYSSIFFDFLATGRPIVFFTPDTLEYAEARGTYFTPEELPGPVCLDLERVAQAILQDSVTLSAEFAARAAHWRVRFAAQDDGHSSARIVDLVFRATASPPADDGDPTRTSSARQLRIGSDGRQSILLTIGGMRSNGITSSILNLLNAIDHRNFDVSVVFARPRGVQQLSNQSRIHPAVRQFHRVGGMNGSKLGQFQRRVTERVYRLPRRAETLGQKAMWSEEWVRLFGDSRFSIAVDFSGYSAFWALLILHSPKSRRSIWMHNDMVAETRRVIRGRRRMLRSLPAVFSLYPQFDSLVSVSASLAGVNYEKLHAKYALSLDRFRSARNLVDGKHVLEGLSVPLSEIVNFELEDGTTPQQNPDWLVSLGNSGRSGDGTTTWFVSVGRFSTEKNQARLLRSFALVHREHGNTRLLLVGYGPLQEELERLIAELGLTGAAFVAGPYPNPFPLLKAADAFVLSSHYEGQPMVLLEAAIAGLPIISVEFDSVHDALPDSPLLIVAQSDAALAEGMKQFLAGEVPPAVLDIESYNREAATEFLQATVPSTIDLSGELF